MPQKLITAHAAKARIGDDHEKLVGLQQFQRLLGGLDSAVLITLVAHDRLERKAHVLLVINNQDGRKSNGHFLMLINVLAGSMIVKTVPLPSSDSTRTAPL